MFESPNSWSGEEEEQERMHPIVEQVDAQFKELKSEYLQKKETVENIRNSDECVQGGSSFYDISGNLLAVLGSSVRGYEYTHDPKVVEALAQNLEYLDRYLELIENNSEVRRAELTQPDGAFPEARQAADRAAQNGQTQRPIVFYIESITSSQEEKAGDATIN